MRFLFSLMFCGYVFGQIIPVGSVNTNFAWTVTNNQINSCTTCTTTLSAPAFTAPLTAGSLILVGSSMFTTFSTTQSLSDTAGNTYTKLQDSQWTGGTPILWCANNSHTTASNVVTITSTPVIDGAILAVEIVSSKTATLNCSTNLDDTKVASGTATGTTNNAAISNSMNLSVNSGTFVFGWSNSINGTLSAGTSPYIFLALQPPVVTNTFSIGTYYILPGTVNPFSGTFSISGGGGYQSYAAAFHP